MFILSKFAERLEECIFYSGKSAGLIAEELGMDRVTVYSYLHCRLTPSLGHTVKLADYFNCSTDYLLGITNDSKDKKFLACPPFSERLEALLKENHYSGYKFCKESKIPYSNFYDWKNGKRVPSVDNVIKIANFLEISVDYLLGREN